MPVNQGSNFNFVTLNPYNFDDWGGTLGSPYTQVRGAGVGPGGLLQYRYPSTVSYNSSADGPIVAFGMHEKANVYMAISSGTSVNGQLSQIQSPGTWFNWRPNGHTHFRFQGDNTSYQTSSSPYTQPASPTNPPFLITDFQASVPGGNAPGVKIYLYHGQNAQLIRQMGFAADTGQTWNVYHAGFDGISPGSRWDFEPIKSGNPYQFDQVTQF
tara:strand:+ start:272 stop:910 length:639 start_codon:yes stop_codon:yes gene_type:complete